MQSWERAPDWVREAVDRCLHDMQQPTVIDVSPDWVVDALFPDPEDGGDRFSSPTLGRELSSWLRARTYCKNTAFRSQKVLGARLDRRVVGIATRRSRRCWTAKPGGSAPTPVNASRSSARTSIPSTGE